MKNIIKSVLFLLVMSGALACHADGDGAMQHHSYPGGKCGAEELKNDAGGQTTHNYICMFGSCSVSSGTGTCELGAGADPETCDATTSICGAYEQCITLGEESACAPMNGAIQFFYSIYVSETDPAKIISYRTPDGSFAMPVIILEKDTVLLGQFTQRNPHPYFSPPPDTEPPACDSIKDVVLTTDPAPYWGGMIQIRVGAGYFLYVEYPIAYCTP